MSSPGLQKNILATIAYYDGMDYPMTAFEIHKYLMNFNPQPATHNSQRDLPEIINELESEKLKRHIEEFRGFYFLKGRKNLVEERIQRNKIAEEKYKILLPAVKRLRLAPYVRMIAVTGSLAMKNTEADSDMDILVVLKQGKIFTGRTLVSLLAHILGKRRHGNKITDRICLNYFITTKSLEITLKDIFSAHEYSFMFPLFGFEIFREFQKQNGWIKKYKPNYQFDSLPNRKLLEDAWFAKLFRAAGETIFGFDFLENWLRRWQTKRITYNPRTRQKGSMIIANNEMLVFLPEPRGPEMFEKFQTKLKNLTGG